MNYRRVMRILAPLAAVILVLAGCAAEETTPPAAQAGPCSAPTSKNISTNPEVATGYRKDMTAVRTTHYAAVTANTGYDLSSR